MLPKIITALSPDRISPIQQTKQISHQTQNNHCMINPLVEFKDAIKFDLDFREIKNLFIGLT
ncbi:MAG: hypothetical protein ACRC47_02460, partial [Shewanella sp.]